ncbi:restriction endonuclease subunit S [Campylobacter canadensis]|uniref:restriction endonuclease subunit S n=1 Tax=Campylobacter canadensis TaxID=449520 RepID=UPI00295E7438|nr:restriction endonuclease subunit S [Campylobacter canadensis]
MTNYKLLQIAVKRYCLWGGDLQNSDIEWKSFKAYDVFYTFTNKNKLQTPTGSYINKTLLEKYNIPRITVKGINNGVDSLSSCKSEKIVFFSNFISVSFLGSVFYHPYKASIDMKVHALIPLNIELNKYIANFLIPIIKNNIAFSSYGNQLSSTDLAQLTLILPIDEKGEPNWEYMQKYIKQKFTLQVKQIIKYFK